MVKWIKRMLRIQSPSEHIRKTAESEALAYIAIGIAYVEGILKAFKDSETKEEKE